MDQITQTSREQWKKIIAECQDSGLPVKIWCEQNGFKEQSYYYYLKKIREQEMKNLPVSVPNTKEEPVTFKKLEVSTPIPGTQAAVVIHRNSASVEIYNGATQICVSSSIDLLLLFRNSFVWNHFQHHFICFAESGVTELNVFYDK